MPKPAPTLDFSVNQNLFYSALQETTILMAEKGAIFSLLNHIDIIRHTPSLESGRYRSRT